MVRFKQKFRDDTFYAFFTRLSIRDLSHTSAQPFTTENGRYNFCFNGEIYGLRSPCGISLDSFKSDTLALGYLIQKYGALAFSYIRGMFAICLYDKYESTTYLTGPIWLKPLFYNISTFENKQELINMNETIVTS